MATIRALQQNYTCIIGHYRHLSEPLQALKTGLGEKLILLPADPAKEDQTKQLIAAIQSTDRVPTHILHFPAPRLHNARFHQIPWHSFQQELAVSSRSIVLLLQTLLPKMRRQRNGRVILVLSYAVNNRAPAYCCDYIVAKYALLGLMKALATEYAVTGITINGISPYMVNTKFLEHVHQAVVYQLAQANPLGHNLTAEDIIPGIQYLLSDSAACVNGENLTISCGKQSWQQ